MVRTRAEQPLYSPLGGGSAPYQPLPDFLELSRVIKDYIPLAVRPWI